MQKGKRTLKSQLKYLLFNHWEKCQANTHTVLMSTAALLTRLWKFPSPPQLSAAESSFEYTLHTTNCPWPSSQKAAVFLYPDPHPDVGTQAGFLVLISLAEKQRNQLHSCHSFPLVHHNPRHYTVYNSCSAQSVTRLSLLTKSLDN